MTTATPSPTICYRIGYLAGAAVRGLLNALDHSTEQHASQAPSKGQTSLSQTRRLQQPPSQDHYSELERTPAMVRRNSIDLPTWYASNVRSKKKRSRKKAVETTTAQDACSQPAYGSLNAMLVPVGESIDWHSAPHWMDNLNTDHWTEADWDRLSR